MEENNQKEDIWKFKDSYEYIKELENNLHKNKEKDRAVGHEMRNRLNVLMGFTQLFLKDISKLQAGQIIDQEKISRLLEYGEIIIRNEHQLESIASLQTLGSIRHRDLIASSQTINLEEVVRNGILSLEKELQKNNLAIDFLYDRTNGSPISIFYNEGFMNAIMSTITFNLIKHAPKYSLSKQGIKIKEDNLEIISENLIGDSRQEYGSKTRIGVYLLELAARQSRGKLELYTNPSKETYQNRERIGFQYAYELEGHDTFGVKLTIPMREFTYHAPKRTEKS